MSSYATGFEFNMVNATMNSILMRVRLNKPRPGCHTLFYNSLDIPRDRRQIYIWDTQSSQSDSSVKASISEASQGISPEWEVH